MAHISKFKLAVITASRYLDRVYPFIYSVWAISMEFKYVNVPILLEAIDENKGGCFVSWGRLRRH